MSPRTNVIPTGVRLLPLGVLLLLAACGEPPHPLPESPPLAGPSSFPVSPLPSFPPITPTMPPVGTYPPGQPYPTYPTYPATLNPTAGMAAGTKSPTPTPSHAATCSGAPTRAQIIALINGQQGIPSNPLKVLDGPYCSGNWSFTTVGLSGETTDQDEALMVVATGKAATLALVAAGSDVCTDRVQTEAPPGIRVLACGF